MIEESDYRVSFEKPGQVTALVGPCVGQLWKPHKIPLDGRHYKCAGKIILKDGTELRANLRIRTDTFNFLEAVWCQIGDSWYRPDEPEFLPCLGLTAEQALPFTWLPDRPLDYRDPGPYPMDWYASAREARQSGAPIPGAAPPNNALQRTATGGWLSRILRALFRR